jgi:DNA-directed RNA polymerase specialized sigma24 family protein
MPESLDAYNDLDQIRRELKRLTSTVEGVGNRVEQVDHKVERSRATQLGALATALAADGEVWPEVTLSAAGMSVPDIAAALGKSENAVRVRLSRAKKKRG